MSRTVIVEIEVSRLHLVARITFQNAVDQVTRRHGQRCRNDQPPVAIEEGSEVVLLFADERAHGAALDQRLHLPACGLDGAFDELKRDGVEVAHASAQPDDQVALAVDLSGLPGEDEARRVELIDHRGADDPVASAECVAPIGGNVMRRTVEPDSPLLVRLGFQPAATAISGSAILSTRPIARRRNVTISTWVSRSANV